LDAFNSKNPLPLYFCILVSRISVLSIQRKGRRGFLFSSKLFIIFFKARKQHIKSTRWVREPSKVRLDFFESIEKNKTVGSWDTFKEQARIALFETFACFAAMLSNKATQSPFFKRFLILKKAQYALFESKRAACFCGQQKYKKMFNFIKKIIFQLGMLNIKKRCKQWVRSCFCFEQDRKFYNPHRSKVWFVELENKCMP